MVSLINGQKQQVPFGWKFEQNLQHKRKGQKVIKRYPIKVHWTGNTWQFQSNLKKMQKEGSKFNQTDVYRVRRNTRLNEALFLCKIIMKKHGSVRIEGMGECISLVSKISQILNREGFSQLRSIQSLNVTENERRGINPKLVITIDKSAQFDKKTEDIVLRS